MRQLHLYILIFFIGFTSSCKKDLLHFSNVQKIESGSDTDRLNKVVFVDANNGFIAGGKWYTEAVILTTHDGGNTWQRKSFTNVGQLLNSVSVAPSGTVYGTGFEGKLMYSNDTGKTWVYKQLEHYWFRDVAETTPGKVIAVGGISFGSGMRQILDTNTTLYKRDSLTYQLNAIHMVTPNTGYICGFGIVLKTTDGGNTWAIQNVKDDNFMAMDIHGDEMWMCGNNGSIYHTTDAGIDWTRQRNGNDITLKSYHVLSILFKDQLNGWAVGENGVVLHSEDGGNHWMEYDQFTTNTLTSLSLCSDGRLLVVGDNGSIYKLTL